MDEKWFKLRQKIAGVTAADIAARLGRDRSAVSKIYAGQRQMSLEWAKAFAEVLEVPLDEVLKHAGVLDEATAAPLRPGFAESDVAPFRAKDGEDRQARTVAQALGERPGVDLWRVKSAALSLMGYMPGDLMLVDTHAAERVRQGDVVLAQVYDNTAAAAFTLLRRYEPPVLVAASPDPGDRRVHVVDGVNVVVRGRVTASWRS